MEAIYPESRREIGQSIYYLMRPLSLWQSYIKSAKIKYMENHFAPSEFTERGIFMGLKTVVLNSERMNYDGKLDLSVLSSEVK